MVNQKNTVESINEWFQVAKPSATNADVAAQFAFFIEEVAEVFDATNDTDVAEYLRGIKQDYLTLAKSDYLEETLNSWDKVGLLDGLCDTAVTVNGVATYLGMNFPGALEHISQSNWSKFDENGKPILDNDGKITKGPNYFKPDLEPFIQYTPTVVKELELKYAKELNKPLDQVFNISSGGYCGNCSRSYWYNSLPGCINHLKNRILKGFYDKFK